MLQKIKQITKNFLMKIGYKKKRIFSNYKNAVTFCKKKTRGAYNSQLLAKYRFEVFENYLQDKQNLIGARGMSTLLFVVSYFLKNNKGKCPRIVDFGGACGETIKMLEEIFGDEIFKKSWVVETSQQVQESKNWEYISKIKFESDLNKIIKTKKIDIFYSSGTIHYLEEPLKILKLIAKESIPIVALSRNNFSRSSYVFAQATPLSWNGLGKHIEKYGNPKIYYPNTALRKKDIMKIFKDEGYKVLIDLSSKSGVFGSYTYGGELIFRK